MPRGGRRPGAGAPKGNWNNLSSGRRSTRLQALILTLRDDKHFMLVYRLLMAAARRQQRRRAESLKSLMDLASALTSDTTSQDPPPAEGPALAGLPKDEERRQQL